VRALRVGVEESEEATALRLEAAIELLGLEYRMGVDEHRARALLSEGLELAARKRDLRSRVLLLINFAGTYGTIGELFGGTAELEEAFELGTRSDDPELRFTVHEEMIDRLHFTGRLTEAASLCDAYVELGRALAPGTIVRGFIPAAWSLGRRAWVWSEMGRLDASAGALRECAESLRATLATEFQGYAEVAWAHNRIHARDVDGASLHARRGFEIAEKVGSPLLVVWAQEQLGAALALAHEWSAAVDHLERALRIARETRSWLTIEAEILAHLAEARLGSGEAEQAQRTAAEAVETARRRKTPVFEARAQLALARVLLARSGAKARDEIERALGSCLSLVEATGARVYEPHVHELRAELARRLGDAAAAERELREAHRLFAATGATGHAERLARELSSS
jgi:tetratricopeptide (TPR) repeat protein